MSYCRSDIEYSKKQKVKDFLLSAISPAILLLILLQFDWVRGNFDGLSDGYGASIGLLVLALVLLLVVYQKCRRYIFYGLFFSLFIFPAVLLVITMIVFWNWNG